MALLAVALAQTGCAKVETVYVAPIGVCPGCYQGAVVADAKGNAVVVVTVDSSGEFTVVVDGQMPVTVSTKKGRD